MIDYKELVEELRSKHNEDRYKRLTLDAADAIERLCERPSMTNYEELVKALRCCANLNTNCTVCPWDKYNFALCAKKLYTDAAAAIEELDAEETRLLLLTSDLQDKLMDLQEQLNDSDVAADDNGRQIEELAKRNAELHAELEKWVSAAEMAGEPKRGEWIRVEDGESYHYECSECGERPLYSRFGDVVLSGVCPMCGAKMNDSNASNALNELDNAQDGPIITPCRGCSDYDGYGGCKSKGGCARAKMEVQE